MVNNRSEERGEAASGSGIGDVLEPVCEENTHRVGENIYQLYIRQRTDNQNI
jgi:hypothetical protein